MDFNKLFSLNTLLAIVFAFFFGIVLKINYLGAIALFILVLLSIFAMRKEKAFLCFLVIFSILIEVSFQKIAIFPSDRISLNLNGIINGGMFGIACLYLISGRIKLPNAWMSKTFALYLAAVLLSLSVSCNHFLTIKSFIRIFAPFCIYLILTQRITDKKDIDGFFNLFIFLCCIPIAVGIFQIICVNRFILSRTLRVAGTFKNGQSYSMYLGMILPFIFAQMISSKYILRKRLIFSGIFMLGVINLLYSTTRIGWGSCFFSIILYCFLAKKKRCLYTLFFICLLLGIFFLPVIAKEFGSFFTTPWSSYLSNDISYFMKPSTYETTSSLHIRIYVWKQMLREVITNNPFLGMGSETWFGFISRRLNVPVASHNDYVKVFFGTGFVGLICYLTYRIKQIMLLSKMRKVLKSTIEYNVVILPALAVFISFIFVSLTESWQSYVGLYWSAWIMLGISECYCKYYLGGNNYGKKI